MSDRLLRTIVTDEPGNLAELQQVKGFGQAKSARWGNAIMEVLANPARAMVHLEATSRPAEKKSRAPHRSSSLNPAIESPLPSTAMAFSAGKPNTMVPSGSLDHALKIWRMREAKRLGIAPFVLMLDAAIRSVVQAQPTDLAALRGVAGMDSDWAAEHGEAICALVREHAAVPA